MKINYVLDKETKGSYRFAPDADGQKQIGDATIYLSKPVCSALGIKPDKGFTVDLSPVE